MNVDKAFLTGKIEEIKQSGNAMIFELDQYYVQLAPHSPGQMLCEAISHHYHSSISIGLESSFAALGFHLEEGGNYSKVYPVNNLSEIDKLADDIITIFRDLFHANKSTPFTVTEI